MGSVKYMEESFGRLAAVKVEIAWQRF